MTYIKNNGLLIGNNWKISEESVNVLVFRYLNTQGDNRHAFFGGSSKNF